MKAAQSPDRGIFFGLATKLNLRDAEHILLKAIELGCAFWDTAANFGMIQPCVALRLVTQVLLVYMQLM